MSLESFEYVKDLIATNPLSNDPKSEGDDHLRGIKATLKNQFSGFTDGIAITKKESEINAMLTRTQILELIYPVGSYYTTESSANPATTFGFGTWVAMTAGQTLVAAGGGYTLGSTGGAATHTLTVDEIPSHTHTESGSNGYGTGSYGIGYALVTNDNRQSGATGGGSAHNNMPPYRAVSIWRRTA
jgi:hypothetical protein